ncbi:MAG: glycosyltransferase [Promethearchaeota archaeon]
MNEIILSICFPTYNRPEILFQTVKEILTFDSNEFEIIISDDNPANLETKRLMEKIVDKRLKFYKNKSNLGIDGNQLLTIHRARGKYVFLMMDDDKVNLDTLPWVISTLKRENKISYLCGSLGNKAEKKNKYYYEFEDRYYKKGVDALNSLLFAHAHASGIILKKNALNLKEAKKYIGLMYIQQALVAQALINGDAFSTSKIIAFLGEEANIVTGNRDEKVAHKPIFKRRHYWTSIGHLMIAKYRIQIILDICKKLKNSKKIRNILLDRQKKYIYINFVEALLDSFGTGIDALSILIRMKPLSNSPSFWIHLIMELIYHSYKSKLFRLYRPLRNVYVKLN